MKNNTNCPFTLVDNSNLNNYKKTKIKIVNLENTSNDVFTIYEAFELALSKDLDLVIIKNGFFTNGKEIPAIAKIINYNKFIYDMKKKDKNNAKRQRESIQKVKCVKFHIGIDGGDYLYKINHIKDFLNDGDKVLCQIVLRGREKYNNDRVNEFIDKISSDCNEFSLLSKPFVRQGSIISTFLTKKEA